AVARAKELAGDRDVTIASANVIQQALDLGLVDKIAVSLVPVLFGKGKRYFGRLDDGHLLLEDPHVVQGRRALHLTFKVRR
ncbi:MAG TPA: dihydrofolate reductase family protein, partial [Candidatus Limnocylindrales bacterium]|nr:dihydrofolate reductase family protein [Candidatus Limnocylindrales bacterium]